MTPVEARDRFGRTCGGSDLTVSSDIDIDIYIDIDICGAFRAAVAQTPQFRIVGSYEY